MHIVKFSPVIQTHVIWRMGEHSSLIGKVVEWKYISNDMHLGNKNMTYKDVGRRVTTNFFLSF